MTDRRYEIRPERDGTYSVRDTTRQGKEIYRTLITGQAARAVAHEMVRFFSSNAR